MVWSLVDWLCCFGACGEAKSTWKTRLIHALQDIPQCPDFPCTPPFKFPHPTSSSSILKYKPSACDPVRVFKIYTVPGLHTAESKQIFTMSSVLLVLGQNPGPQACQVSAVQRSFTPLFCCYFLKKPPCLLCVCCTSEHSKLFRCERLRCQHLLYLRFSGLDLIIFWKQYRLQHQTVWVHLLTATH